jgi:hypothetical protein
MYILISGLLYDGNVSRPVISKSYPTFNWYDNNISLVVYPSLALMTDYRRLIIYIYNDMYTIVLLLL